MVVLEFEIDTIADQVAVEGAFTTEPTLEGPPLPGRTTFYQRTELGFGQGMLSP
jgi:hypothetical protein